MKKNKSLGISALLNVLNTIIGMCIMLITFPYVSRMLGVDNLGKINFSSSVVSYFSLLAALGIGTYATREGAIYREDKTKFNGFANEIFSINIVTTLISLGLLTFFVFAIPKFNAYSGLIFIQSLSIIFNTLGLGWLYAIYEEYVYIFVRNLLFQIVSLLLIFALIKGPDDYIKYAVILAISNGGSCIFNFFNAKKHVDLKFSLGKKCFKHIKSILLIFANSIASTIYVNSDNIILGFFCGDYPVGLYAVAVKIYTLLKTLINALFGVALPRISLYFSSNRTDAAQDIIKKITEISFMMLIPIIVGINILSEEVIIIVGGSDYVGAEIALRLLMCALIFSIFASVFSTLVLLPNKLEKVITTATCISAVTNIVLNMILIKLYQQNAAAFTTLISEIIVFAIMYIKAKPFITFKIEKSFVIKCSLGAVCMIPIGIGLKNMIANVMIRSIACVILCACTYGVILLLSGGIKYILTKDLREN